jgi:putative transposase
MPTHFHWLIYVKTEDITVLQRKIGDWLSGYTRGFNKQHSRSGSLFQQHSKARLIKNDRDLLAVATYIHQNPVRTGLVRKLEAWPWSSYPDYIGIRNGTLPVKS